MKAREFFSLLRPLNCGIAGIAALIGYWISASGILLDFNALAIFLAVFCICGAGQAINDYFDLEIDRKKKLRKALALGRIKAHDAFAFSIVLFLVGIVLSVSLGTLPFIISIFMSLLLIAYSAFPKLKVLGNWIVALGTAMTILFGASVLENFDIVIWLFVPMLFANSARELIKDLEDLKVDKGLKLTLPMIAGEKNSKSIVGIYLTFTILAACYIFAFGIVSSGLYLLLVFIAAIVFFMAAWHAGRGNFAKAQKFSKLGMLLALLAFFSILL